MSFLTFLLHRPLSDAMKFNHPSLSLMLVSSMALLASVAPAQAANLSPASLGLTQYNPATQPVGNGLMTAAPVKKGQAPVFPYLASTFSPSQAFSVNFSLLSSGLGSRGQAISGFGLLVNNVFQPLFTETQAYDPITVPKGSRLSIEGPKNDWLGTCGKTFTTCQTVYTFTPGNTYQLALSTLVNGKPVINSYGLGSAGSYTFDAASDELYPAGKAHSYITVSSSAEYALFIGMEDGQFLARGGKDRPQFYYDYQDYVVQATPASVPEPATMAGLAVVGGGLAMLRRRKESRTVKA